jgi:hypothetical protein
MASQFSLLAALAAALMTGTGDRGGGLPPIRPASLAVKFPAPPVNRRQEV